MPPFPVWCALEVLGRFRESQPRLEESLMQMTVDGPSLLLLLIRPSHEIQPYNPCNGTR